MVIDLLTREVRVANGGQLHAFLADEINDLVLLQPAVLHRLVVERRARIRRRQRHLDRVRVDLLGVLDRLFDGFLRLARQPQDKRAVNLDVQLAAVFAEASCDIRTQALLDVQQDLVVARLVAHQQQPQAVFLHDLEGRIRHVRLRVAGPRHAQLAQTACDLFDTRLEVGEGVVVEHDLLDLGHVVADPLHFLQHVLHRARAVAVAAYRLRPQAERALRTAAAARVDRDVRMLQVTDKVILDLQVTLIDRCDKGQFVHVLEDRTRLVVLDRAIRRAVTQALDLRERLACCHFLAGEIEFFTADEIDRFARRQRVVWIDGDLGAHHADHH